MTAEGIKILKGIEKLDPSIQFDLTYYPWGCEYYLTHGQMMADDGMEQLAAHDAILLGAVGYPGVPDNISLRDLLLRIRKGFDQYVNLRPIKLLRGALWAKVSQVSAREMHSIILWCSGIRYSRRSQANTPM